MITGNIVFYTPERMAELWGYIENLLSMVSPGVMIAVAIIAVGMILTVVVRAWKEAAAPKEQGDDIEIRRY